MRNMRKMNKSFSQRWEEKKSRRFIKKANNIERKFCSMLQLCETRKSDSGNGREIFSFARWERERTKAHKAKRFFQPEILHRSVKIFHFPPVQLMFGYWSERSPCRVRWFFWFGTQSQFIAYLSNFRLWASSVRKIYLRRAYIECDE